MVTENAMNKHFNTKQANMVRVQKLKLTEGTLYLYFMYFPTRYLV